VQVGRSQLRFEPADLVKRDQPVRATLPLRGFTEDYLKRAKRVVVRSP